MGFERGQSGNPTGRPKGSANKVTSKIRETIIAFLDDNFTQVKEDFVKLKPVERARFYVDLLQYAVPKLQSVQLETDFDQLTDQQIDEIINALKNPYYEPKRSQPGANDKAGEATAS